jgi:HK97 family phage portal protein
LGFWKKVGKILRSKISIKVGDDNADHSIIFGRGGKTNAGTEVTERTAMNVMTVLACVRLLAGAIASMPCVLFQRKKDMIIPAEQHPAYTILKNNANNEMTSMSFFETSQLHEELWGNRYAQIIRTNGGDIYALQPLQPDRTIVMRAFDGRLLYQTLDINGRIITLEAEDVLHVPGLGYDGLVGRSPVAMMRESLGLAVASEEFGARFFSNGAAPAGFLRHPTSLSKPAQDRLKEQFDERYAGVHNAHRTAVLEEGMEYVPITMPLKDSQFLEGRSFQQIEIASAFQVPPILIGLQEKTSSWGTGIEQIMIGFLTFSLRPKIVRIEQALNRKLLTEKERKEFYFKFNTNSLLRGDTKTRFEGYQVARQNGWMNTNEIRAFEEMNPVAGGEMFWRPANMVPADSKFDPANVKAEPTKKGENV